MKIHAFLSVVLFTVSLLFICGCDANNSTSADSQNESTVFSKKEKDYRAFIDLLESLNADHINKIQMLYVGGNVTTTETNDPELVVRWVDLCKQMHIVLQPGEGAIGASIVLNFIIDGEEKFLGSYMGPDVVITNDAYGKIENYEEIEEKFNALVQEMKALPESISGE